MALSGYFGRPGSGKSYSVVEYVILPALAAGRHVVTNIPLEVDLLLQVYGGKITQLELDCLDDPDLPNKIPHGACAVIDECWRRWPSGQKVSAASTLDLQWLKEHRHRVDAEGNAQTVTLVTQDPSDLASWVRKLIAHSFHMYKLDSVGASGKFGIKVYLGCPTGDRIPKRLEIRQAYGTYKPEIYQYYRSATQSQTLDVGDEKSMDKRTNVWTSGSMIFIGCFVVFAALASYFLGSAYLGKKLHPSDPPESNQVRITAPEPKASPLTAIQPKPDLKMAEKPSPRPEPKAPSGPLPSGLWRMVGFIAAADPDNRPPGGAVDVAILRSVHGDRYVPLSSCTKYPAGDQYSCIVDGELVTPWTGNLQLTKTFEDKLGGAATGSAQQSGDDPEASPRT